MLQTKPSQDRNLQVPAQIAALVEAIEYLHKEIDNLTERLHRVLRSEEEVEPQTDIFTPKEVKASKEPQVCQLALDINFGVTRISTARLRIAELMDRLEV